MRNNIVIKMNLLVCHIHSTYSEKVRINYDGKTAKNSSRSTSAPPMNKIAQHKLTSKTIKLSRLKNVSNRNVYAECISKNLILNICHVFV